MRGGPGRILAVCVTAAAVGPSTALAARAEVTGSLYYEQRNCFAASTRHYRPIAGAKLVVSDPHGGSDTTALSEGGRFSVSVPGRGRDLTGLVVFDDGRIRVQPDPDVAKTGRRAV